MRLGESNEIADRGHGLRGTGMLRPAILGTMRILGFVYLQWFRHGNYTRTRNLA